MTEHPEPPSVTIDGRSAFTAAVRHSLAMAFQSRARALCFVDPDYCTWPLEDDAVRGALAAWARLPLRRLLVVAGNFDALPARFPRFTVWRRSWAHVIECRQTDVEASQIPSLLLAGEHSLYLPDRLHWRGHGLSDEAEVGAWREVVDVLLQRSEPGFSVNTLGL